MALLILSLSLAIQARGAILEDNEDLSIEQFVNIDPDRFPVVSRYLRGYPIKNDLWNMAVPDLEDLLVNAHNFEMAELETVADDALLHRFNPFLCGSPSLLSLEDSGKGLKRLSTYSSLHISCSVYGVLKSGTRYMEYDIVTQGNRYIMIGVAEADGFRSGPFPGASSVPGISYYGANGKIYRNGGNQDFGSSFSYGDRFGVLVEIADDQIYATITFYRNGEKIANSLDLKDYMSIDEGIVFTVNLYSAHDEVRIIQDPSVPSL